MREVGRRLLVQREVRCVHVLVVASRRVVVEVEDLAVDVRRAAVRLALTVVGVLARREHDEPVEDRQRRSRRAGSSRWSQNSRAPFHSGCQSSDRYSSAFTRRYACSLWCQLKSAWILRKSPWPLMCTPPPVKYGSGRRFSMPVSVSRNSTNWRPFISRNISRSSARDLRLVVLVPPPVVLVVALDPGDVVGSGERRRQLAGEVGVDEVVEHDVRERLARTGTAGASRPPGGRRPDRRRARAGSTARSEPGRPGASIVTGPLRSLQ